MSKKTTVAISTKPASSPAVEKYPVKMVNGYPRRQQIQYDTFIERKIRHLVEVIEMYPAHPRLSDAVVALEAARNAVADYIDETH